MFFLPKICPVDRKIFPVLSFGFFRVTDTSLMRNGKNNQNGSRWGSSVRLLRKDGAHSSDKGGMAAGQTGISSEERRAAKLRSPERSKSGMTYASLFSHIDSCLPLAFSTLILSSIPRISWQDTHFKSSPTREELGEVERMRLSKSNSNASFLSFLFLRPITYYSYWEEGGGKRL